MSLFARIVAPSSSASVVFTAPSVVELLEEDAPDVLLKIKELFAAELGEESSAMDGKLRLLFDAVKVELGERATGVVSVAFAVTSVVKLEEEDATDELLKLEEELALVETSVIELEKEVLATDKLEDRALFSSFDSFFDVEDSISDPSSSSLESTSCEGSLALAAT